MPSPGPPLTAANRAFKGKLAGVIRELNEAVAKAA